MPAFLQNIGGTEILVIFFIILLLFGAKRLPELFRAFGRSLGEFKKASREIEDDFRSAMDEGQKKEKEKAAQAEARATESAESARPSEAEAKTDAGPPDVRSR